MPNIPPRGLPARYAGLWKNPDFVYARDAGVWKSADYVWGRQAGAWQLLWARTAGSPATATATYTQSQVKIDWVPATPAIADAYKVLRPDATVAGIVNAPGVTFTDPDPRPMNGAYSVVGVLGGTDSTVATATNVLDLRLAARTPSAVVNSPGTNGQTVTLNWLLPTIGAPDYWNVYRIDGGNYTYLGSPTGTAVTFTDTAPPAGQVNDYRIRSALAGTYEGSEVQVTIATNAKPNSNLTLTATTSPLSNLRLGFYGPASGGCSSYRIERYVASTGPWTFHESNGCADGSSDWSTTVAGYMRVRTESPGGPSEYTQVGPVTPTNDITGPGPSTITSWAPESSYGRLVVRGNWSPDGDTARGQIYYWPGSGNWVLAYDSSSISPSGAFGVHVVTGSAGVQYGVLVRTFDSSGNQNSADAVTYRTLSASPIIVDANDSATWRGSGWRTDGTSGTTGVMHGRTSSGENYGYWFYGEGITNALAGKTLISGTVEYNRTADQGSGSGIQPQFFIHQNGTQPAGQPALGGTGTLGSAVARSGTTGGAVSLNSQWLPYLQNGSYKGFGIYRATSNSNDADAGSFYMKLNPFQTNSGGKISGRVTLNHLG